MSLDKKNCSFPVAMPKYWVGRLIKKNWGYFFGQICVFYACFMLSC